MKTCNNSFWVRLAKFFFFQNWDMIPNGMKQGHYTHLAIFFSPVKKRKILQLIMIQYIGCDPDILGNNVQRAGGPRDKLFPNMSGSQPMY